ncbi:DNA mismatch repair protein MutS [Alkalibacterium pelagium]|uniref:DNA mismatch repair protein MutS n=1 Tax=Alkalibacterium pelagium TaxID=426702 RepID=A0A1H7NAS3_9LACT|nr:DNA mismatch repair protein MutS [Alkalibacterium pelagium]GEN51395.1 DNA mismatch repair protein MutS [Alkalibacterium pelagium]SEL20411.1 DNA mismatch repair protein MutS [Alkalibacterium pelagium]
MPQKTKHTPMMEQYLSIKKQYPYAFLFYRLGDFYELFFDDAVKVARLLELTLTSRNKNAEEQIPMCGVPHHSAKGYIDTLIEMGYKVAICEQVEDPKQAKGMVKREVVQVVTPGTVMQSKTVEAKENNYIAAVASLHPHIGLSYADLTTGEIKVTEVESLQEAVNELVSIQCKEVIIEAGEFLDLQETLAQHYNMSVSHPSSDDHQHPLSSLTESIQDRSLIRVIDLLLAYLSETQMRSLDHLQEVQFYETRNFLLYGQDARRNLELTTSLRDGSKKGTLLWLMDETQTAMGGRMLRSWLEKPLIRKKQIEERLDKVEGLLNHFFERNDLVEVLKNIYDLERLAGRVAFGTVNARDLIQLKQSLDQIPHVTDIIDRLNAEKIWDSYLNQLDPINDVRDLIEQAIDEDPPISVTDGEIIRRGYHEQLDKYKEAMTNGKRWMAELEQQEREATGIKNLKIGFNKVFGYYIEVSKGNVSKLQEGRYERKQTLTNAERYSTPELKEKEALILEAEEKSKNLEYDLFVGVRQMVKEEIDRLQKLARAVAEIDVLQSFAAVSEEYNYVRPKFSVDSQDIHIKNGRHPVVEKVMGEQSYVPNDVDLTKETSVLLITGPNMSGKSTFMRQLALSVIMAQMGCFVPAESASLPVFDRLFTRIGAMDDLIGGQSTFMVEMNETNQALQHATENSLLLFDEIGRGTATYDGMALAEAIIEYVHDKIRAKTLFSTHYHELTVLEERLQGLKNVHVGAVEEEGNLVFLHKMMEGPADKSYGVQVARLAGLPDSLLDRAGHILSDLEQKEDHLFEDKDEQSVSVKEISQMKQEQLNLFDDLTTNEKDVISALQKVNVLNTTPIEALQLLSQLQDKIENR